MSAYEGWAIVELMGHRRRAGRVSEVEQYGARLLRVDIPIAGEDGGVTEFYGGSAIYGLHPTDEAVARAVAEQIGDPRPVAPKTFRLEAPLDPEPRDDDEPEDELGDEF